MDISKPTSEAESLLIQHYIAARDEILSRIEARRQTVNFYLTGVAAVMGFALHQSDLWPLFYLIPFLGLFAAVSYVQDDLSIRVISIWLRTEYSAALEDFRKINNIRYALPHWDGAPHEGNDARVIGSKLRYYAADLVFVLAGLTSLAVASIYATERIGLCWSVTLGFVCVVPLGATVYIISRANLHRKSTSTYRDRLPRFGS
jgi:hypothetical protein